ncbi:telomere-protecting terminal protein Tpg [Streptomyces sp. NPDC096176]|uniref:telomere-protecting terminal protein Tpg n=1 Tax=Streptomyces sp. NPDC096176 TaxID=3366079 RepID=UPI003801A4FD
MTTTITSVAHSLDLADARHWTHRPPRSPAARIRHLLRNQDTEALAHRLFAYPAAVARWADGDTSTLSPSQAALLEREIIRTWQTHARYTAHQRILDHHGCVAVQLHARFTYSTLQGEFDDPRLRHLTEELPQPHRRALFEAHRHNAGEDRLRRILADGIGEAYFFHGLAPDQQQAAITISDLHSVRFHY